MKLPRIVKLDSSDDHIFEPVAQEGEWAVTGSFAYSNSAPGELTGKKGLAFASGWLGLTSFGRASLVVVGEITEEDFFQQVEALARHFVERYGAPDLPTALLVARQDLQDTAELCEAQAINQILRLERGWNDQGQVVERIKLIEAPREKDHAKIWSFEAD